MQQATLDLTTDMELSSEPTLTAPTTSPSGNNLSNLMNFELQLFNAIPLNQLPTFMYE